MALFGHQKGHLGAPLAHLGLILGSSGSQPGPSWRLVGSTWSPFGSQSAPVGGPEGPVGAPQGPIYLHFGLMEANLAPNSSNYAHLTLEIDIFFVFSELRNARFNRENVCFLKVFSCIYSWIFKIKKIKLMHQTR